MAGPESLPARYPEATVATALAAGVAIGVASGGNDSRRNGRHGGAGPSELRAFQAARDAVAGPVPKLAKRGASAGWNGISGEVAQVARDFFAGALAQSRRAPPEPEPVMAEATAAVPPALETSDAELPPIMRARTSSPTTWTSPRASAPASSARARSRRGSRRPRACHGRHLRSVERDRLALAVARGGTSTASAASSMPEARTSARRAASFSPIAR